MRPLTGADLQPEALRERPDDAAGLLRLSARIRAVRDWLSNVDDDVRDELEDQLHQLEAQTGAVGNLPVSGVGRVLLTDPAPKPRVSEPRVFADWLAVNGYEHLTAETVKVEIHDHHELAAALDSLEAGDDGAAEVVLQATDVDRYRVPAADALDTLLDDPDEPVEVLRADPYDPWVAYIDEDGEPHELDGTDVSVASRRLQVRVDRDHKDELRAAIKAAVGPAELDGGTGG